MCVIIWVGLNLLFSATVDAVHKYGVQTTGNSEILTHLTELVTLACREQLRGSVVRIARLAGCNT